MPNVNAAVIVSVHKNKTFIVRSLALIGVLGFAGLSIVLTLLAIGNRPNDYSCAFRLPNSSMGIGRSNGSKVDRGECVRLGRVSAPKELQKGLSGRDFMPRNEGLLFEFSGSGKRCMWMKDMRISLDIIWLDDTKTINHIEQGLSPQTYPKSYCGNGNSEYVIEVNSGVTKDANLKIGQQLNF